MIAAPAPCVEHGQYPGQRHYGNVRRGGQQIGAHVAALIDKTGALPDGRQALHHCDNKRCINGDHLYWGTHTQNMADRNARDLTVRGERQHLARLTAQQVIEIRWRVAAGENQAALAREFGLVQGTISAIHRRNTWAHLPEGAST